MLPKRQQIRKIGRKRAVNVAKKATFTGPGTIELIHYGAIQVYILYIPLAIQLFFLQEEILLPDSILPQNLQKDIFWIFTST